MTYSSTPFEEERTKMKLFSLPFEKKTFDERNMQTKTTSNE
jgi:hypothetical protein